MTAVAKGVRRVAEGGDLKYWVGFDRVPFIGPVRIQRLLDRFEDLEAAWTASPAELGTVLDQRSVESLVRTRATLSLDGEMERLDRLGMQVVTLGDAAYPRLLAEIPAPRNRFITMTINHLMSK